MYSTICFNTDLELCDERYSLKYDEYIIEIEKWKSDTGNLLFIQWSTFEITQEIGRRFLSEIAWLYNVKIHILTYWWSWNGKAIFQIQPRHFYRMGNALNLSDYEQIATLDNQKLALWIFREWLSSESVFYSFLCYARIINMAWDGSKQKKWINDYYKKISSSPELCLYIQEESITDIWIHIYASWRCAIAHADISQNGVIANPDNFWDSNRIHKELIYIKELAVLYMKNVLHIPDERALSKCQKMRWFREILGDTVNIFNLSSAVIDSWYFPKIPDISLWIYWFEYHFELFDKMVFSVAWAQLWRITLNNFSSSHPVRATIIVDFSKFEVDFDILKTDFNKEHPLWCDKFELDYLYFLKWCIHNNKPLILDTQTWIIICKLNNYIPINIRVDHEKINQEISELERKLNLK